MQNSPAAMWIVVCLVLEAVCANVANMQFANAIGACIALKIAVFPQLHF